MIANGIPKHLQSWLGEYRDIIDEVTYKDWEFITLWEEGVLLLQIQFSDGLVRQYCRKWYLSATMTPSDVVKAVWLAVKVAEEHETAENFRYRGKRIFSPHYDVNAMVEFSTKDHIDAQT